jgi:tetratricopeptide (TPR) repeat protein
MRMMILMLLLGLLLAIVAIYGNEGEVVPSEVSLLARTEEQLEAMLQAGKSSAAISLLSSLPAELLNIPTIKLNQARAYAQLHRFSESENVLQDLVRSEGKQSDSQLVYLQADASTIVIARLMLGKIMTQTKRYDDAEEQLNRVLQLDSGNAEAHLFLGKCKSCQAAMRNGLICMNHDENR